MNLLILLLIKILKLLNKNNTMTIQQEYQELIKFGLDINFDSTSFFYEGENFNLDCDIFNGHLTITEVNDEDCNNPFSEKETQLLEDSLNECNIETVRLTKREKRNLQYLKNN